MSGYHASNRALHAFRKAGQAEGVVYQAEGGHVGDGLREEGLQVLQRVLLEQQAASKLHRLG